MRREVCVQYIRRCNDQKKLLVEAGLPGTTRIPNPLWQYTFVQDVEGQIGKLTKGQCTKVLVLNTIIGTLDDGKLVEAPDNQFLRGAPWPEVWTVNGCGTVYLVPMSNTPTDGGISTNINTKNFLKQ